MAHTYTYKPIRSLLLVLLLLPTAATAQRDYTADSIAFVNADWHPDTLNGFHFLYHHFMHRQVFNSNQCFSIIEIPSGSPLRLGFVADSGLTTVSNIATRHGALAAINGSFFDMDNFFSAVGADKAVSRDLSAADPAVENIVCRECLRA